MASSILRRCTSILSAQPAQAPFAHRALARRANRLPVAAMASSTQAPAPLARSAMLKLGLTAFALLCVADCAQAAAAGQAKSVNVLGGPLEVCCKDPMTGYTRDGTCRVIAGDSGNHSVCALMTEDFMSYTASQGNDLSSVVKPGQRWCLCAGRWKQAKNAGKAPPVVLKSTAAEALASVTLEELKEHASDADAAAAQ